MSSPSANISSTENTRVSCPKCKHPLDTPDELSQRGVARMSCPSCACVFVARLGTAAPARDPAEKSLPVKASGLKSSGSHNETAGEIGESSPSIQHEETRTTIIIDDSLVAADTDTGTTAKTGSPPPPVPLYAMPTQINTPHDASSDGAPLKHGDRSISEEYESVAPVPHFSAFTATPSAGAVATAPDAVLATAQTHPNTPYSPLQDQPTQPAPPQLNPPMPGSTPFVLRQPNGAPQTAFAPYPPQTGRTAKAIGLIITSLVFASLVLLLFVLHKNDWSVDPSNIDKMLDRAFGDAPPQLPPELAQLEVTQPIVDKVKLADGTAVVTAEGVLKNVGTITRRFVHVRAMVKRGSRTVGTAEAPAGNLFQRADLIKMTYKQIETAINPAGQQGRNALLKPGESIAYMVVIPDITEPFDPSTHVVQVKVLRAEIAPSPPSGAQK